MPLVREVGFELVKQNRIDVCQKGVVVPNPQEGNIVGPIRFRIRIQE